MAVAEEADSSLRLLQMAALQQELGAQLQQQSRRRGGAVGQELPAQGPGSKSEGNSDEEEEEKKVAVKGGAENPDLPKELKGEEDDGG